MKVITSKNGRTPEDKKKDILDAIARADHPLFPKEISSLTRLNRSTVRVYLRQYVHLGLVKQPFRGVYVINPTHGVGRPPRIQNLWLSVTGIPIPTRIRKRIEVFGDVKIQVIFGGKRGKITGILSSRTGMDLATCTLAIERFKTLVKDELGIVVGNENLWVRNCEFLEDHHGMRLEGINCVTVKSFLGSLERIYNKATSLRSEVKVKPDSVESIYALLKGGVTSYNIIQGIFALIKKIDDLTTAQKFGNETMQRIERLLREHLNRILSNHFSRIFKS